MRLRTFVASSIIALVVIASHTSEASPIIFTERAAFEAAAQPNILATFETLQPTGVGGTFCSANDCSGVVDGVLLVSSVGPCCVDATGALTFGHDSLVTIGVGGPMTAVGFDVLRDPRFSQLSVGAIIGSTATGDPVVKNIPLPNFGLEVEFFLGLLFPEPIFGLQLRVFTQFLTPEPITVDNIAIRSAPVPEPATALLVLGGAMVLLHRRRRS